MALTFSFRRKETPALQVYGKLPLARDYLRVGCGEGSGRALREWLDQAFSGGATPGEAPLLPFPMRFVVGEGQGAPLQGCAWPSSDEGGARPFPVAAFVERRAKPLLASFEAGLAEAEGWWRRLEAVRAALDNYADGASLLAGLRGRRIEGESIEPAALQHVNLAPWVRALWPERDLEGLHDVARRLDELAAASHRGPVRLPIASGFSVAAQVHGWWRLLGDTRLRPADRLPTAFFPQRDAGAGEEPLFAVFFPGPPGPDAARWLTSAASGERLPGDLCDGRTAAAGEQEPDPENVPSLADSLRGALMSGRSKSALRSPGP